MSVNYAIFRFKKLKYRDRSEATKKALKGQNTNEGHIRGALNHLFREIETPNADSERTSKNRVLVGAENVAGVMKDFDDRLPKKIRVNAVKAIEVVVTGTAEGMKALSESEQLDYFKESLGFIAKKFGGEKNILSAIVHNDETTPHLSVMVVPLVDGKLNAKKFVDGKFKLREMQTDFANDVAKKYGLERGVERIRPRNHIELQKYYKVTSEIFEQLRTQPENLEALGKLISQIDYENNMGDIVEKLSRLGKGNQARLAERISKEIDERLGDEKGVIFERKISISEAKKLIPEICQSILNQDMAIYRDENTSKINKIEEFERASVERIDKKTEALKEERERLKEERDRLNLEKAETREELKKEVLNEQNSKFNKLLNVWKKADGSKIKDVDEFNNLLASTINDFKEKLKDKESENNALKTENNALKGELKELKDELKMLKNNIEKPDFLKEKLDEIERSKEQSKKVAEMVQKNKTSFKPF